MLDKRHTEHWDIEIRRGSKRVAREHTETAAVGRNVRVERNFHGEVRDARRSWIVLFLKFGGVSHLDLGQLNRNYCRPSQTGAGS
jgi:hypothetical protein